MSTYRPRYRPNRRSLLKGASIAAVGLTMMPRFSLADEEKQLNFYNWDTYIGELTLADFETATGIETKMDLFADNDELFAKLKGGNPGYDVIVPTNDNLERMIKANMVMPIDHAKIPNMANIDAPFQDSAFDPGPQVLDPLYVGHARHRLSQVEDRRRRRFLEGAARFRSAGRQDLAARRCRRMCSARR